MNKKHIENIAGNEQAKRALEIAFAGKLSIKFIGNGEAKELASIAKEQGIKAYSFTPCPCGNLNSNKIPCTCLSGQIANHRRKEYLTKTDMTVKTVPAKVKQAIDLIKKQYKLDKEAILLLEIAYVKMNLDYYGLKSVLKTAEAVAKLNKSVDIRNIDIGEALQYRPEVIN